MHSVITHVRVRLSKRHSRPLAASRRRLLSLVGLPVLGEDPAWQHVSAQRAGDSRLASLPPASDRASVGRREKVPETRSAASLVPRPASSVDAFNLTKGHPAGGTSELPTGDGRAGEPSASGHLHSHIHPPGSHVGPTGVQAEVGYVKARVPKGNKDEPGAKPPNRGGGVSVEYPGDWECGPLSL